MRVLTGSLMSATLRLGNTAQNHARSSPAEAISDISHALVSKGREGELQPSLLVTRLTSWRKRASPAAGRCPPVAVLQAYRSCIKHAWVMCRGARLEALGLGRGAAQSPWFSRRRGEKKKSRSSWLNDLLRCSRSESGRPGGAPAEAHPAMHASCAWTFHQHWRRP